MNWKTLISLLVAMVMGLAALYVGKNLIGTQSLGNASGADTVKIVVAKHDLDAGTQLTADDVTAKYYPAASLPKGAMKDPKDLVGRVLVGLATQDSPVLERMLAPRGTEAGLAGLIPAGFRAVAIDVNEASGVAGLISPGCRVDVIATLRMNEGEVARTIVENARVQAVNRKMTRERSTDTSDGAADTGHTRERDRDRDQSVKTVTLIVTPKDAASIELAGSNGRLRLVLRGSSDHTLAQKPQGVSYWELTGQLPPQPATQPADPTAMDRFLAAMAEAAKNAKPVTVQAPQPERVSIPIIRGGREEQLVFERKPGDALAHSAAAPTTAPSGPAPQPDASSGWRSADSSGAASKNKDKDGDPFR